MDALSTDVPFLVLHFFLIKECLAGYKARIPPIRSSSMEITAIKYKRISYCTCFMVVGILLLYLIYTLLFKRDPESHLSNRLTLKRYRCRYLRFGTSPLPSYLP